MRITNLSVFVSAILASSALAWKQFVVPHSPGQDDTPALMAALPEIASNASILFKKGITYNIFTPIVFPVLNNVEIAIEGNLTYPTDIPTIQNIIASGAGSGYWISFKGGNNVTLRGTTDPDWGWIDGHGQAWWDAGEQDNRPHGLAFSKITNGIMRDLKVWQPIAHNFATSGAVNVHVFDNRIHAISNSDSFPFNTDGFSAGGTNLLFERNFIQNGDDCLTVGNGAKDIIFRDSYCEGGHGLSIGSLGSGGQVADVQNVLIENNVVNNSLYAARFKSWTGGNGLARNITWRNIEFHKVMFPIYVTQNYWDQETGPRPNSTTPNNTHIADFIFENFTGDIRDTGFVEGSCVTDPCWYFVPNATGKEVVILDLYPNTATNIRTKAISAKTDSGAPVDVLCDPATIDNDVGFKCVDGHFVRTAAGL